MEYDLGPAAAALRQRLRGLVGEHVPADYLGAFTADPADLAIAQRFCATLAEEGLLCLAWPEEFGGRGASLWEQTVVREEMWAAHEPRGAQYMGVNWVGPTIMRHGSAEQQARHLPPIARGEVIWCQGFSEPGAGSDLASLRTAARQDEAGDGRGGRAWRVYGQKIWTSYATMAQWCFLLARTSTGGRKQQGLTIFLVPMDAPGIEVRPIDCMMGPHHLNEVFFDGVRVTEADVLGTVDAGWAVVQEVLAFERVGIARYARCERLLQAAPVVLGDAWADLPAALRGRWARMLVHARRARLLAYRVVARQGTGQVSPVDSAAYRIAVTKLDQDSAEVLVEIINLVELEGAEADYFRREVEDHARYSVSATVASGSIEMQRILLSRALTTASGPLGTAPARTVATS
ncbi:acyl-CoA dehydrogenase family protein [Frankia sp. CNm7]|uniref:Acyl-CoA dehydrogenase family protein n=1 Tax=Frankia nepalensis TaxID=1836974 RepID=A0A937RCU0_9ACTN|nr:acyl-CoA dehydrogenase family protein [Frankia nepalensis]MBL7496805.1 acyl-CoA dehydrogenase family protein [Frankia nepalensis]MBL7513940.1 acyl-CoA dehydrogenase family protein [Frankia nepalensis]MBL7523718.1 acyl-CoA dehydrogenase family protein [Frankia nepalensis]MBL7626635.1 acyl-CoA dehydrogenase family protein [Frankia nepalensis]